MVAARCPANWVLTSLAPPVDPNAIQFGEYLPPPTDGVAQTILTPRGTGPSDANLRAADGYLTETIETNWQCRAVYLERVTKHFSKATVCLAVVTKLTMPTWAEIAICKYTPKLGTAPSLTLLGYVDVSAEFQLGGAICKDITLNLAAEPGDHLWFAWSQRTQQGVLATFHPAVCDPTISSLFALADGVRPSTMASPEAFVIAGASLEPAWPIVGMS